MQVQIYLASTHEDGLITFNLKDLNFNDRAFLKKDTEFIMKVIPPGKKRSVSIVWRVNRAGKTACCYLPQIFTLPKDVGVRIPLHYNQVHVIEGLSSGEDW